MNWMFTRPGRVVFEAGAAVCVLLPVRHDDLSQFTPTIVLVEHNSGLPADYLAWREGRQRFLKSLKSGDPVGRLGQGWQGDYLRGDIGGVRPSVATPADARAPIRASRLVRVVT